MSHRGNSKQREKLTTEKNEAKKEDENCILCTEDSDFWVTGHCGHSCCVRCAIKLRWKFNYVGSKFQLQKTPTCPWCRNSWAKVTIGKVQEYMNDCCYDKNVKAFFQSKEAGKFLHHMLEIRCPYCDISGYKNLIALKKHMKRAHDGATFCNLCVDNNKKFLDEHTIYCNKHELERHINKIHPRCHLCHTTVYNEDSLENHLKVDHHQCPACSDFFAEDVSSAKEHYRTVHYLCELDQCKNNISLFLNAEEFRIHQEEAHTHKTQKNTTRRKKKKAKKRPQLAQGLAKGQIEEEMGMMVMSVLSGANIDLLMYHSMLFSANIDPPLLFKSFRDCWSSVCAENVWENYWLKVISTCHDNGLAKTYYYLYEDWCNNPTFDSNVKRWSPVSVVEPVRSFPSLNANATPYIPARRSRGRGRGGKRSRGRSRGSSHGNGRGNNRNEIARVIPRPAPPPRRSRGKNTSRGVGRSQNMSSIMHNQSNNYAQKNRIPQPSGKASLRGAWAKRSQQTASFRDQTFPDLETEKKGKKKKKKRKKKKLLKI